MFDKCIVLQALHGQQSNVSSNHNIGTCVPIVCGACHYMKPLEVQGLTVNIYCNKPCRQPPNS